METNTLISAKYYMSSWISLHDEIDIKYVAHKLSVSDIVVMQAIHELELEGIVLVPVQGKEHTYKLVKTSNIEEKIETYIKTFKGL